MLPMFSFFHFPVFLMFQLASVTISVVLRTFFSHYFEASALVTHSLSLPSFIENAFICPSFLKGTFTKSKVQVERLFPIPSACRLVSILHPLDMVICLSDYFPSPSLSLIFKSLIMVCWDGVSWVSQFSRRHLSSFESVGLCLLTNIHSLLLIFLHMSIPSPSTPSNPPCLPPSAPQGE